MPKSKGTPHHKKSGKSQPARQNDQFLGSSAVALLNTRRDQLYRVSKTLVANPLPGGVVDSIFDISYQLSDLPENGAMLIMFAEYRIMSVQVSLMPMFRANPMAAEAASGPIPRILIVFSPEQISLASKAEFERYQNLVINDDETHTNVRFSPVVAQAVYQSALSTSYAVGKVGQWLPTNSLGIPHYGLHILIEGSGILAGPFQQWNMSVRYNIEFRVSR
jgi:hypothetical protein